VSSESNRVILNQDASWDKVTDGGISVYSRSHCCQCGRPVNSPVYVLLCSRDNGGEWYVCKPGPLLEDEADFDRFFLPIGPECLKRHPEYRIGLYSLEK